MPFAAFDWPILIIPAIGLVVWLVSALFRNATEPPKKPPLPQRPPVREPEEPRRQTSSDLDRFIAETRRQREADERRAQRPPQPARPQRRPILLEEVEDEPRPRPAPRPPMSQPRPVPPRPTPTFVPVVRPARVPVLEIAELAAAPVLPGLPQTVLPTMPEQPTGPVDVLKREEAFVSPLLRDIQEMLKSPKSAQLALVLREVFDQPLCRRRRR
jgi:hypothetical protein